MQVVISISKHLDYQTFIEKVFATFKEFNSDEVWGVRKVCIENLAKIVKHLNYKEDEKL